MFSSLIFCCDYIFLLYSMYGAVKENLIFLSFSSIKLSGNISQQNFFCKFFCVGSACGIDCDQLLYNLQYSTVQYSTVQYSTVQYSESSKYYHSFIVQSFDLNAQDTFKGTVLGDPSSPFSSINSTWVAFSQGNIFRWYMIMISKFFIRVQGGGKIPS